MEPIAVALSQETIATLADYYAKQTGGLSAATPPTRPAESGRPDGDAVRGAQKTAQIERGRTIAMRGIPKQRVPACADCHGPSDFPRNPNYPALAGQYADYLVLQLTLFKKGARGGTDYAHLMRPAAAGLTPQQMRDVASYYESLGSPAE
jgi:cytochrome c553